MSFSVTPSATLLLASVLASSLLACSSSGDDGGTGGAATGGVGATGATGTGGIGATGGTGTGGVGATGGTGTGGVGATGGTAADPTVPTDTSQAGLEAWLATQSYRSAPWVGEDAPRPTTMGPHRAVRAFLNPTAMASIANGQNEIDFTAGNTVGSVGVKELYDDDGNLVGTALMLRNLDGGTALSDWLYYCKGGMGQCAGNGTASESIYGQGASECKFCHSGLFFSPMALAAAP